MRFDGPRFLSRPLGVHWAGWETNTYRLQQSGWDLAVQYQISNDGYTLLMKHAEMQLYGYTDALELQRTLQDPYMTERAENLPIFQVRHMARVLLSAYTSTHLDFASFSQIDATPQFTERKIQSVEDFNIFALARAKAEEVLVNRADMSVIEHLEAIKALQEPRQHEIRQRMLSEGGSARGPRLSLVAQLVHVEAA